VDDRVETIWTELVRTGKAKYSTDIVAINPRLTRLVGNRLVLDGYPSEYKHYKASLVDPTVGEVWLTGPSAIVQFQEAGKKYVIFGERKSNNLKVGGNIETLPAGFLDVRFMTGEMPLQECLYNEQEEELGLEREIVTNVTPMRTGYVHTAYGGQRIVNVSTDFILQLGNGVSLEYIMNRFRAKPREHTALEIVDFEELEDYVARNLDRFNVRTIFSLEGFFQRMKNPITASCEVNPSKEFKLRKA
jgi:hypothetical protein